MFNGTEAAALRHRQKLPSQVLRQWYETWDEVLYPHVAPLQDDTDADGDLFSAVVRVRDALGARVGALARGAVLEFLLTDVVTLDYANDPSALSLWWWDADAWLDDVVQESRDSCVVPGYGALAEEVAAHLPPTAVAVHLSRPVGSIALVDGRVALDDDETAYDRVVVALPLGVVQDPGRVVLDPPLASTAPLAAALASRFSGDAEKYVLVFDAVFWDDTDFLYTVEPDPLEWLNLRRALATDDAPGPPGLAVFTAGRLAAKLAKLDAAALRAYLLDALKNMYPEADVAVVGAHFTDWRRDPYTLGAWSSVTPGAAYDADLRAFQGPILEGAGALAGEYLLRGVSEWVFED